MLSDFRDESFHHAVARSPNVDAVLKTGSPDDGLRIGGVEGIVAIHGDVRGTAELLVFRNEFAVLIEHLDTVVAAVGDEHAAGAIHHHRVKAVELAGALSVLAPCLDEFPVFREFDDPLVAVRPAVTVRHEDVAVGCLDNVCWRVERVGSAAGDTRLAQREHDFAVRVVRNDRLPLADHPRIALLDARARDGVRPPHAAVPPDVQTMRPHHRPRTPAFDVLPGLVDLEDRILVRRSTFASAASREDDEGAVSRLFGPNHLARFLESRGELELPYGVETEWAGLRQGPLRLSAGRAEQTKGCDSSYREQIADSVWTRHRSPPPGTQMLELLWNARSVTDPRYWFSSGMLFAGAGFGCAWRKA